MDLYKEWTTLNEARFSNLNLTKEQIMEAIGVESNSLVSALRRQLKAKVNWILFFMGIHLIWMLCSLQRSELLLLLGLSLAIQAAFLICILPHYQDLDKKVSLTDNTLSVLTAKTSIIKRALRNEFIIGVFNMPLSVVSGILLLNHYQGYKIVEVFNNTYTIMSGLVCLILLVPLGILLAMRLNEIAFGKYLKQLEENIVRMKSV